MFSLSSLVGGGKGPTQLEFTPIGKRGARSRAVPEATPLERNETVPNSPFDSSPGRFDSTFSLDQLPVSGLGQHKGEIGREGSAPSIRNRQDRENQDNRGGRGLVGDGASSIQNLQNEVQQLLSENYNLKVEVATLKQYLRQSPLETRDLALENANLKQDLMELTRQVELAKASSVRAGVDRLDNLDIDSKFALEKKDRELEKLQQAFNDLQQKLKHQRTTTSIPDEVVDRIEYLEGENQALHRQLQDAAVGTGGASSVERENDLKTELHRLKTKLALFPPDIEDQVRSLTAENDVLTRKLQLALADVQQLQNERDSFEDQLKSLQVELDARNEEVRRWRRDAENSATSEKSLSDVQRELTAAKRDVEELLAKLSASKREVQDLKSRHSGVERENRHLVDNLETQVSTLQNKLKAVNETLKDKDRDNYELRAEVRSLMDERSAHFDNQTTVRHYQLQIDALRRKEEEMDTEIAELRTALASERSNGLLVAERDTRLAAEIEELQTKLDYYEEQYGLLEDAKALADGEVELLESKLSAAESLLQRSDVDKRRAQDNILELEKEVEELRARVRRSEITGAHKYNELALLELDELHQKREDSERKRLHSQINDLRAQVHTLEQDLERARTTRTNFSDLTDVSVRELQRLRNDIEDKEIELREHRTRTTRLQSSLKDKDLAIDALEARVRELNRELKTTLSSADTRWNDVTRLEAEHARRLQDLRFEHEKTIRNLQLENERLERVMKDESRYYKAQADTFQRRNNSNYGNEYNKENVKDANSAMVALLEVQLEGARRESQKLQDELQRAQRAAGADVQTSIDTYKVELRELQRRLENLQSQVDSLKIELESTRLQNSELRSKHLQAELDKERIDDQVRFMKSEKKDLENDKKELESDKKDLESSNKRLDSAKKDLEIENKSLQSEAKSLQNEIKSLQSEFKALQSDYKSLQSYYKSQQNDNKLLQSQVSELLRNESVLRRVDRAEAKALDSLRTENNLLKSERNKLDVKARNLAAELERTSLACTTLAVKMKAMEVQHFRQSQPKPNDIESLGARLSATTLSDSEVRFWKNKVYHLKLLVAETSARYDDLRTAYKYASQELKKINGERQLQNRSGSERRPSFKHVALMVLAGVRMKRMGEKGKKHKKMMEQIQRDIARDRELWQLS